MPLWMAASMIIFSTNMRWEQPCSKELPTVLRHVLLSSLVIRE